MNDFTMNPHAAEADRAARNGRGPSEAEVQRRVAETEHLIDAMRCDVRYMLRQLEWEPFTADNLQRAFDALDRVTEVRELFEPRREP